MRLTQTLSIAKALKAEAEAVAIEPEYSLQELKTKLLKLSRPTGPSKDFFIPNKNYGTHARRKRRTKNDKAAPINWTQGLVGTRSPKATTSIQAKSNYDVMIKDWIGTNWINVDQVRMQEKPCHFLIHDRLMYSGLSVFDAVFNKLEHDFPQVGLNRDQLNERWRDEFATLTLMDQDTSSLNREFRELVKNVFWGCFKMHETEAAAFKRCLADQRFEQVIASIIRKDIGVNEKMVNYLKNFENLNMDNSFTFIKDRELSLLPSLNYTELVNSKKTLFHNLTILDYAYVFGNKVNDFKNLDKLKQVMTDLDPYYILLTNDKQTSLEYYRLFKLMRPSEESKNAKKGCVVYLNEASKNFFPPESKARGYQPYNVIDHFGEVYDVLEGM